MGPAPGPVISGLSVSGENWRWSSWELLWLSGPLWLLLFSALPETSADNMLLGRACRLRRLTGKTNLKSQSEIDQASMTVNEIAANAFIKPWEINALDPAVLVTTVLFTPNRGVPWANVGVWLTIETRYSARDLGDRTVGNLGNISVAHGIYRQASTMHDKEVEGGPLRQPGEGFVRQLTTANNLSISLGHTGDYKEQEELCKQALDASQTQFGRDHPHTLNTLINLGVLYEQQGKYQQAEEFFQRALEGQERTLGQDHPDTLKTAGNLALIYERQGRYKEAAGILVRVLEEFKKQLGCDHPDTLLTTEMVAAVYSSQGLYEEAERLYDLVLEGLERQLGHDHRDTLDTVHNLASLYVEFGRYTEAEEMYNRAISAYEGQL
ncbi:hypothetical protein BZG36_04587, partial [Bifiguratus adelaidae]